MVYDKARSGDPDFDDKVPMDQHAAKVVTAGDGREVIMSPSLGPVDGTGQHVNLDDPLGESEDNRPVPGEVATEASTAQTYTAKDVPTASDDLGEVSSQEEAEKAVADSAEPAKAARTRAGSTSKSTTK
jgi:hypothetical protein